MSRTGSPVQSGADTRVSASELGLVAAAMALVAAVTSYPLVLSLGRALPFDLGDPLLNTFILNWDADRLRQGLQGLWDAPFYFRGETPSPTPNTCWASRSSRRPSSG